MTKTETAKIMSVLKVAYPRYYKDLSGEEISQAAMLWFSMLGEYLYSDVSQAVKGLIAVSKYPPTVADVIEKLQALTKGAEISEVEAWGMVKKALRNSYYNSETEFNLLPTEIQAAIGSHSVLREWALVEGEGIETVVASNFMRSYRAKKQKQKEYNALPNSVKEYMAIAVKNLDMNNLLEGKS